VVAGGNAAQEIRMLGPRGNPQVGDLFGIIGYLQKQADVELHLAVGRGKLEVIPVKRACAYRVSR
jgi:hypothetical protein